jgi:hypothetical protein
METNKAGSRCLLVEGTSLLAQQLGRSFAPLRGPGRVLSGRAIQRALAMTRSFEHCTMIVLDTQNVRGAPEGVFRQLVERGFSLHISAISLEEIWAQAVREKSPGLLRRLRMLARYIDEKEPIKTAGVGLVRRLGGVVRAPFVPADVTEPGKLRELWPLLIGDQLPEELIAQGAKLIDVDAQARDQGWIETSRAAAAVGDWDGRAETEEAIVKAVTHKFFQMFGSSMSIRHGMQERFQGYYRAAALHAARAKARVEGRRPKIDENDAEDLQLLMHIAEGAFVATYDLRFIEHVDASRSFQAPWVRTIGELLRNPLPVGMPWGRAARRAAHGHAIRDRQTLKALEDQVRAGG